MKKAVHIMIAARKYNPFVSSHGNLCAFGRPKDPTRSSLRAMEPASKLIASQALFVSVLLGLS